jgi:hypothetical protein
VEKRNSVIDDYVLAPDLFIILEADLNVPMVSGVLPNYTFDNWYGFAIPNGGNVLENKKVMSIMTNFSSYQDAVRGMVQSGFILEKPNKNIGQIIDAQTKSYQK